MQTFLESEFCWGLSPSILELSASGQPFLMLKSLENVQKLNNKNLENVL